MSSRNARSSSYDAVVIGARCAGAATALLLARRGFKVLAVDKSRHASDTLSTHALMRGAVLQLHRWGVLDAVRAAGTPLVSTTSFHYADEVFEVAIKPRDGIEGLYAPRRTVLDPILADAAAESGAEIIRGSRVVDLIRNAQGRVQGVVVEHAPGQLQQISADLVIGADGVRSTVARVVNPAVAHQGSHATGVVYGYWEGLENSGYHWYFRPGASAGVIPTNGATCVFASMSQQRFWDEARFDLEGSYASILEESAPAVAESLKGARRVGQLHGYAGQSSYLRQCWGPGWALVGDASYFKDPLTAHGITDALRDAELLARAAAQGSAAAMADYQRLRDELSVGLFEVTDSIASFDWSLEELQQMHKALSDEMKQEVKYLSSLQPVGEEMLAKAS